MEGEMPDARIGAQAIEHGSDRERRVHNHQMGDFVAMRLTEARCVYIAPTARRWRG